MGLSSLYKRIDKVSVVSFDIFDTLLLRPYIKPEDLFLHIEKIYGRSGFAEQRMNAENLFYRKNGREKEANIDDIYGMLPEFRDMKQHEMDFELQVLELNPEMKPFYDYAIRNGKTVIICSDMYLPFSFVEKLLEQKQISGYTKLYLSNALNLRKDKGDMFDYVVQDLNVKPSMMLHIGDNKKADYSQAVKHGLQAYLYSKVSEAFFAVDRKFAEFYGQQKDCVGASAASALAAQKKSSGDYWIDFGYKYAGPVVYAYVRWIDENARKNGVDNLLFVARDGFLMKKVFDSFNQDIKSHYVYAPRVLNYTSNLDYDTSNKEQARIVCEYFGRDPGQETPQSFVEKNKKEFEKLALAEKERTGYAAYIKKLTAGSGCIAVTDSISGRFSGQRLIEKEAGAKTVGFYFLTLGTEKEPGVQYVDYMPEELRDAFIKKSKCDLVELIFSAPENPVITMCYGEPVRKTVVSEAELVRQQVYKKIESGVLSFVQDVRRRFGGHDIYFSALCSLTLLDLYVSRPEKPDIRAMAVVKKSPHADNSEYIPLFAADLPFWKVRKTKDLLWPTFLQRLGLVIFKPLSIKIRGMKKIEITLFPYLKRRKF